MRACCQPLRLSVHPFSSKLPWQGLKADTKKQKYNKIMERKKATHVRARRVCWASLAVAFARPP